MSRAGWIGLIVGVLILAGIGAYLYRGELAQITAPDAAPAMEAAAEPEAEAPAIEYPVPVPEPETDTAEPEPPLPALKNSDEAVTAALKERFGAEPVEAFLIPDRLVERLVVTVNSSTGEPAPRRLRPLAKTPGEFEVARDGTRVTLSPDNAQRYQPLVSAIDAVSAEQFAAFYFRYYPLFQEAYEGLGYPDRYFNDRLIQVIDHLLATPDVAYPIQLVPVKSYYQYADPALERLSSGQKALIRLGPEQAATVKAKLREIRAVIVERAQSVGATGR